MDANRPDRTRLDDAPDDIGEPPVGRRQKGVADRRRQLVRAAGELIMENDDGNFSMPELAKRAGLSLATPYNLFGSKASVLGALLDDQVRGFYRDESWTRGTEPLARIVEAVDRLVDAFSRRPRFFRNLRKAFYGLAPSENGQFSQLPSGLLIQPLVRSLARDGLIATAAPLPVLENTLTRLFNAVFEEWALQDWPMDRLRRELLGGFVLIFYGLLADEDAAGLSLIANDPADHAA